ncbi:MAG: AAA family ATPase [Candidatus Woesebacteria bacterium]|nr:MAG: AAA family ATPase [Candidatus Woesebacteria bacterium]
MVFSIKLSNFRNYKSKYLEFSGGITAIVGPNASGKTNILEALFLLSTGKSFKARTESEMINYGQEIAKITGSHFAEALRDDPLSLGVMITEGRNAWPKKRLLVNGVPRRMVDFAGNFKTVLFGPWDMDLVTESPSIRRKFLDNVLSQTDREYRRSILSYEKGLRQRNKLLWRIREEGVSRSQLLFWNQLLIKNGDYITKKRTEFIIFVNNLNKIRLEYDKSIISEGRLEQYAEEEVASATTLVGPHRDDFIFFDKERELSAYGSRGEQRMGVLWLKLAELSFIENVTGEKPTLLLDDIFSELDHEHRDVVMELAKNQQTIITTADEHFLEGVSKLEKIDLGG